MKGADNFLCKEVCVDQGDNGCKECPINKAFERLAAYEDAMSIEQVREIAQARKDGRLIILPKVEEEDRKQFINDLNDYFEEISLYDFSVGIFGMNEGERELAYALITALNCKKVESII